MSEDRFDRTGELEPAEQAALDALLREPQLTNEEWETLHASVMGAAAPALAARRTPAGVIRRTRGRAWRWLLPALPLAAAAALVLVLRPGPRAPAPLGDAEAALLVDVSDREFGLLVSGHSDAASLLLLAVQDEHED